MQAYLETLLDNSVLLVLLLPLVGAGLCLAFARFGEDVVCRTALANVVFTLALTLLMVGRFDPVQDGQTERPQMTSSLHWIGAIQHTEHDGKQSDRRSDRSARLAGPDIRLAVGVDGISLWLIALTAVVSLAAVLFTLDAPPKNPAGFYATLLLWQTALTGTFAALDVVLFCVFLELALVASYCLIGRWGGPERRRIVDRFLLVNLTGSLLVLAGLTATVVAYSWMRSTADTPHPPLSFSIHELTHGIPLLASAGGGAARYWHQVAPWIFGLLVPGFAIRVALFPFHTWLAPATVECPSSAGPLLLGVMLPAGGYGFLRFLLPLFPEMCAAAAGLISFLAIAGIVYGGLLALAQDDLKQMAGYIGLSQMGLCVAGIFSLHSAGVAGGLLQLVNHGLSMSAFLLLLGFLERRHRTLDVKAFGGLATASPRLSGFFLLIAFSLAGLPGLNGFAGQLPAAWGVFQRSIAGGVWVLVGRLLLIWALVWLIQRVFHGQFREPAGPSPAPRAEPRPRDLRGAELAAVAVLAVPILWIGLTPNVFLARSAPAVSRLLDSPQPPASAKTATGPAARKRRTRAMRRAQGTAEPRIEERGSTTAIYDPRFHLRSFRMSREEGGRPRQ